MSDLPSSLIDRLISDNSDPLSLLATSPDPLPLARSLSDRELILAAPEAARRLRQNLSIGSPKETTAAAIAILDRSPATSSLLPAAQATLGEAALQTLMSGLAAFIGSAVSRQPTFRTVAPEGSLSSLSRLPPEDSFTLKEFP